MYEEMNLEVAKGHSEERHFHPEIEILFIIEGEVNVKIKDSTYDLQKEDLILINSGVMHEIKCRENAIVCTATYSYAMVTRILESNNIIFYCNSVADRNTSYDQIRTIFHNLVYQYIRQSHRTLCRQLGLLYQLLDCLIESYQLESAGEMEVTENDVRLQQIFQYVSRNFQTGVSLSELAEELFVSTSTLSRFFKKQTGIYFADYVNQIKCRYAIHDLLYTNKNITKIALDAGFSNPSAFNKIFRDIYGMAPSEYRRDKKAAPRNIQMEKQLRENLRQELKEKESVLNPVVKKNQAIYIPIDTTTGVEYEKNWNRVINLGSAYSLTIANVQYHTLYVAEQLGYRYIRLWSIFSEKLMLTDGKTIGNYNYDMLDGVLDFLVKNHLYPFLDFGKRPDAAIMSENQPIFYGSEYIEFESKEVWQALFEDFIRHIVARYGREEVSHWYFEISYDRNHIKNAQYYKGEDLEYYDHFKVYHFAYQTVKQWCPEAQIGGPGGIVDMHQNFLEDFLLSCKKEEVLPDFVSFILFPYETHFEDGKPFSYRANSEKNEYNLVQIMRAILDKLELTECKLFVTEWNNTVSSRNFLNDSCFRAAYFARKVADIWDQVDLMAIWTASDWVSNYYDSRGIANGGNGILTKDSIRKPVFFAIQFLNKLGNVLIDRGDNYIVTRKGSSYYILCFNYKWYSVNYFLKEEGMDSPDQIENMFGDDYPVRLSFVLNNMPEGIRHIIKRRSVNDNQGSVLGEWKQFQYDYELRSSEIKYIRDCCFPDMSMERSTVQDGKLMIETQLQPHEVVLYHIYEENR